MRHRVQAGLAGQERRRRIHAASPAARCPQATVRVRDTVREAGAPMASVR
jgi:hypothetical protein